MMQLNIDTLPVGLIAVDGKGTIREINLKAKQADIWAWQPSEGVSLSDCISDHGFRLWLSQPLCAEYPYDLITVKEEVWQFNLDVVSEEGDRHLWLKEITETAKLKDTVQYLQKDIERLDLAMQGANIGIWDFNPSKGQIVGNRTWATQKKLPPEEILADDSLFSEIVNGIEKWSTLVHPDDLESATRKIQEHLEGKTELYHAEFRVKCGDGSWKWILDQGKVFERDENGVVTRMNGIHVDVDKLKDLQQKLTETRDKAEVANRAKSIFLANMSHELRTPLNAILGYSQLLKNDERLIPQHQEYLEIINRSGEHLLSLINDVLDMSKIDAGHNVVEHKWFNFREVIEEVKDLMQMKAMQKQLCFQCDIDEGVPKFVSGDAVKTRQILINLIGNAIKFTDNGHVNLQVNSLSAGENRHKFSFKVSDTGIGIEQTDLDRIFQPFEQVGSETTQGGTGLGLSISRQFVELMGGRLEVSSEPNKGSVFTFKLDMDVSDDESKAAKASLSNAPRVLGLKEGTASPKILVAEDQVDNQKLITTLLSEAGFTVKLAQDGEEAVSLHKSWHPDFIWMDRRMPVKDGLQATKEIRLAEHNSDVKIAALTASVFNDEVEQMLKAGMDDFARKPFLPQELFQIMSKHLRIEYIYEGESAEENNSSGRKLDRESMQMLLTAEQMDRVIDAAEQGDQQELFCLFEQFVEETELRSQLVELVENYQFDELFELFQHE